jgi:hypothetical protein
MCQVMLYSNEEEMKNLSMQGGGGIEFIFFPEQHCLRLAVHYSHFVVKAALPKLHELGIAVPTERNQLTDEELERLIRGRIN